MANTTSVGNLSLNITARIATAVHQVDKLTASLNKANQQLILMGARVGKVGDVVSKPVTELNNKLKDTEKQAKANTKALQTMSGTLSKAGQVFAYQIGFGSLQQSINTLKNIGVASFKEAIDFVENYNLFNVSFGGEVQDALKFQNQLNQAFAVNMSESLRYQGFFKNLTTSLGITNDASALLSENLTKLTYDLSSLYNVQFVDMYTKLQSGLIGQTKPLRSVGIDVTQQTLQPYLYDMGINKKVTELTQAEKVLLRYIAILKQSSTAHGDFARTIETPANQLKILRDQVAELGRWFGTVFMGVLGSILPYINGFIIALKEMFKAIAVFFGFNLNDYNFLGEQEIPDYEGELNGATQASEELKKSLMGFDEINNMGSQSTGGNQPYLTGGYSETYTKLLEELEGYDNLMSSVRSKASDIAESILRWLGFTKEINSLTGDVNWKFTELTSGVAILATIFGRIALKNIGKLITSIGTGTTGSTLASAFWVAKNYIQLLGVKFLGVFGASAGTAFVATITGITVAVVALYAGFKALQWGLSDSIKEVDIFGKEVSDLTKSKVEPFIDSLNDLDKQLDMLDMGNDIVSEQDKQEIGQRLSTITKMIIDELDSDRNTSLQKLEPLRHAFSNDKFNEIVKSSGDFYNDIKIKVQEGEARINEIVDRASKERRELTSEEQQEIERIQEDMKKIGITLLSETSRESEIIFQRIKDNSVNLSKQQTAEILLEAYKLKDEAIKSAEEQYYGIITEANRMYEFGAINKEEYDTIVAKAKEVKEDTIKEATDQYDGILKEAETRFPKITKYLDTENGKIKKNWEVTWDYMKGSITSAHGIDFNSTAIGKYFRDFMSALQSAIEKFGEWLRTVSSGTGITIGADYVPNPTLAGGGNPQGSGNVKTSEQIAREKQILADKLRLEAITAQATANKTPKYLTVGMYASGGMPSVGEMFIARESGAELVGSIGSRSAVMNNDQIVQAVSQGVAQAVASVIGQSGGDTIIQVNDDVLGRASIKAINKVMKNTNLVLDM